MINLLGIYHYDAHSAIVELRILFGVVWTNGKLTSSPGAKKVDQCCIARRGAVKWPNENGLSERHIGVHV